MEDKFRKLTRKEMFFGIEQKPTKKEIIEKLSYSLGEAVGLLKGIEQNCHDKMLKYEIRKAIDKLEKIIE
jgi:hypothetical protein